jgi:hypothetical protein
MHGVLLIRIGMSFGNMSGWIKCWLLTMALMEIMDNHHHHHRRRQYITLTLDLSKKQWPKGSNLT